jgi:hypothetical protein
MTDQPPPAFFEALARELAGSGGVTRDPAELAEYGRDWTRVVDPAPCAVAFPKTTDEVARVVRLCAAHGVAVVPSGGRTGLAGGRSRRAASSSSRSQRCARCTPSTSSAARCACRPAP